jgi:hypothetical protein
MTLEFRTTDEPDRFDLYDGDERIGVVHPEKLSDREVADGETPCWEFTIWSVMGTGKEWHGYADTFEEIQEYALEEYEGFRAERRELSKGSRTWTTGSIPMGGKPGWRRR